MAIKVQGQTVVDDDRKGSFQVSNPGQFTTAERDALTPVVGDMIFNTDEENLEIWDGSDWKGAGGGDGPVPPQISSISLTEDSSGGNRFTDQKFNIGFAMANDGIPVSQKGVKGEVIANFPEFYQTDEVDSVDTSGSRVDAFTQSFVKNDLYQYVQGGALKNSQYPSYNNDQFKENSYDLFADYDDLTGNGPGWILISFYYISAGTYRLVADWIPPDLNQDNCKNISVKNVGSSAGVIKWKRYGSVVISESNRNKQCYVWDFMNSKRYITVGGVNNTKGISCDGKVIYIVEAEYDSGYAKYRPRVTIYDLAPSSNPNDNFVLRGYQSLTAASGTGGTYNQGMNVDIFLQNTSRSLTFEVDKRNNQFVFLVKNYTNSDVWQFHYYDIDDTKFGRLGDTDSASTNRLTPVWSGYNSTNDGGYEIFNTSYTSDNSNIFFANIDAVDGYNDLYVSGNGPNNESYFWYKLDGGGDKHAWTKVGQLLLPGDVDPNINTSRYPRGTYDGMADRGITRNLDDGFLYVTWLTELSSINARAYLFRSLDDGNSWQTYGPLDSWNDNNVAEDSICVGTTRWGFGKELGCSGTWRYNNAAKDNSRYRVLNTSAITLEGTSDLEFFTDGDAIYKASDPYNTAYFGVIANLNRSNGTLNVNSSLPYAAGDVLESRKIKGNNILTRYLVINSVGTVTGTSSADPGYITVGPGQSQEITFAGLFDTGSSPDDELPAGTQLQVYGEATNASAADTYGPSNTVTPT